MTNTQPLGFLAVPTSDKGPGVLVLHAWWGLNDTIKTICKRLAEAGFVAFAPDLYHGKLATTIQDADTLSSDLDANRAKADIAQAVDFLSEQADSGGRGLGVIGFSLGAYYALGLASDDPDRIRAVVVFYGTGDPDLKRSTAAYLGHFAENDDYEPASEVMVLEQALRAAGRPVSFYQYPDTGHWFFEQDRSDAYNHEAAQLAWQRTVAFFRDALSP